MEIIPGYKQTEIGVIPEDWEIKPLEEIGEALNGLTYKPCDVNYDGTLVLRSSNVQDGSLQFDDNIFVNKQIPEKIIVRAGDILICVRNGSRSLIGKCAKIDAQINGQHMTFGAFMAVFRTQFHKFIFHLFQADLIKKQINEHLGATINQITNRSLNSFKIPFPTTIAEQEAIAEILNNADALIKSLEQLITKKYRIKQGVMQNLFLPKDGWKEYRIGDLLKIMHGKSQHNVIDRNGAYPILATSGQIGAANQFLYDRPSVLIGRKGTIDRPQFMIKPFWTVDTLFYSIINEPNIPKYLFYQFCLIDWKKYNESTGVPSLNARTIENINLKIPLPNEQNIIANILSDIDSEIEALEAKLTKARQLKQGMMQELLTGRIRLI